jgi:hypothetical protein
MNYQIVSDESLLKEFISFLPDTASSELYYVGLYARKKYCAQITNLKSDKQCLARFTSDKTRLFEKLKQLEVPLGCYSQKGIIVPQEALAAYITVNPRDLELASKRSLIKLAELNTKKYDGYNPHQEVMSEIQKACGTKTYIDFDFDCAESEVAGIVTQVQMAVNNSSINVLKTRGGIHVLINLTKVEKSFVKTWYKKISSIEGVDQIGDNMIPIMGCYQGGFIPRLIVKDGKWM